MTDKQTQSELIESKLPCPRPECGSSDAAALYDDGHYFCFSCNQASWPEPGEQLPVKKRDKNIMSTDTVERPKSAQLQAIPARGITKATSKKWGYYFDPETGDHYATYCNLMSQRCAYKVRKVSPKKDFYWKGSLSKEAPLYGQWLWSSDGGKIVVVTEGELDAMSVSQAQNHRWPVVSLPNGADKTGAGAAKDVAKAIQWLSKFEKVVLWFDPDTPGRASAQEVASILPPGKAFIVKAPKDANQMLMDRQGDEIGRYIHTAEEYVPGGVVSMDSIMDDLEDPEMGIPWSHDFLNEWTFGRRFGEVYTFGAGTGVGKSDFLLQEMAHTIGPKVKQSVALFSYENGSKITVRHILGKLAKRRLHIPDKDNILWTSEDLEGAKSVYRETCAKLWVNDSRGSADWDEVKDRSRYLAHAHGVKHFVYDNLSALVDPSSEKEDLERIMSEGASLADELDVCIYFVSHLTTPESGSHEEGARVTIRQFKGSRSIGFWSFFMFGMERNQQPEEGEDSDTIFRCLKDRFTGNSTGNTQRLNYNLLTGMNEPKQEPEYGQTLEGELPT